MTYAEPPDAEDAANACIAEQAVPPYTDERNVLALKNYQPPLRRRDMIEFLTHRGGDGSRWDDIVDQCPFSDFFHRAAYHAICADYEEATAELAIYREDPYLFALPLLIRPIPNSRLGGHGGLFDATSVYGYTGPLASHPAEEIPSAMIGRFQRALTQALIRRRIVSLFCRLNPLTDQAPLIAGLGTGAFPIGQTVSIDLTLAPDEQWRQIRRNHRVDIRKAADAGVRFEIDDNLSRIRTFSAMYHDDMVRLGADPWYYFSDAFFDHLKEKLAGSMRLMLCFDNDRVVSGLLVTLHRGIAHTFLSARAQGGDQPSSAKLAFNCVRLWAGEQGAHTLFLGGGVGGKADSLLRFKEGFSKTRHTFCVWRWVVMPEMYAALCQKVAASLEPARQIEYFPSYRTSSQQSYLGEHTSETMREGASPA